MRLEKICCAVDLSDASHLVLEGAIELAAHYGAVLSLVHVVRSTPAPEPSAAGAAPDLDAVRSLLEELRDGAAERTGAVVFSEVLVGDPAEEIVRYAGRHEADLVVLGTHGHSGMKRLVLGSVAELVVRRAPCPVLVVRPKAPVADREKALVEEYSAF